MLVEYFEALVEEFESFFVLFPPVNTGFTESCGSVGAAGAASWRYR